MVIDTIFGKAKVLMPGPGNTIYVRCLNWTPEQVEKMGGEKNAWILIDGSQVLTKNLFQTS